MSTGSRGAEPGEGRTGGIRTAAGLFLAFFLAAACWALATPIFSAPDEPSHLIKAAGTVRGQLLGEDLPDTSVTLMRVPAWLATANEVPNCYRFNPVQDASCAPPLGSGMQDAEVPARAGRYPPFYYALVGPFTLLSWPAAAVILMRLATAALGAAFLAAACTVALSRRPASGLTAGLALAVTPMTLYLLGTVNPNALEIAAAVCLWTLGAVTALDGLPAGRTAAWRLVGIGLSAATLALTRSASPVFVAVTGLALLAFANRKAVRSLAGDRRVWVMAGLLLAVGAAASVMVLASDPYPGPVETADPRGFGARFLRALARQDDYALQMVGVFGNLDTPVPGPVAALWLLGLAGLLVVAIRRSPRRAAVIGGLALATVLLSTVIEAMALKTMGVFWQGRYSLPLAAGLPVLAGCCWTARAGRPLVPRAAAVGGAAVLAACHAGAFLSTVHRFAVGADGPWSFAWSGGGWRPEVPVLVTFPLFSAAVAYIAVVLAGNLARPGGPANRLVARGPDRTGRLDSLLLPGDNLGGQPGAQNRASFPN